MQSSLPRPAVLGRIGSSMVASLSLGSLKALNQKALKRPEDHQTSHVFSQISARGFGVYHPGSWLMSSVRNS